MAKSVKLDLKEISRSYQRRHLANIERVLNDLMTLMEKGSNKVAYEAARKQLVNNRFLPLEIRKSIDRIITVFHDDATKVILNGMSRSRRLAEEKTNLISRGYIGGGRKPPTRSTEILGSSGSRRGGGRKPPSPPKNTVAENFENRFSPRSLSPRVWKLSNSYKASIKKTLVEGLREGTGAKELARTLRRNLRNNEAVDNPGQGVYRNPRRNAERLARTEINMAYEHEDYKRWQQLWFVVGIEVRLSAQHPKYDICDTLVGKYPKDFLFPGWHPNCLCIAVPILAPQEIRDKMMDYNLGIIEEKPNVEYITELPGGAKDWLKKNSERVKKWKNTPYFIQFNDKYISQVLG